MEDDHPTTVAIDRLDLLDATLAPGTACATVADACNNWHLPQLVDTASLLVSELVTNAFQHAQPPVSLRITRLGRSQIRVEVADRSGSPPLLRRDPDMLAPRGRGLLIVDTLATSWGHHPTVHGKVVWFETTHRPVSDPI